MYQFVSKTFVLDSYVGNSTKNENDVWSYSIIESMKKIRKILPNFASDYIK